ncbi:hypothetical protein, partial [Pseudoalteromonas sp. SYSU M81241]
TDMDSPEYRADAIELITRIIASMAALGQSKQTRVEDLEEGFISRIVGELWDEKGQEAEVTDVWDRLKAVSDQDQRLLDVIVKLQAFTKSG